MFFGSIWGCGLFDFVDCGIFFLVWFCFFVIGDIFGLEFFCVGYDIFDNIFMVIIFIWVYCRVCKCIIVDCELIFMVYVFRL